MILAVKITSLGDDSATGATDRRYRWSSGVPTGGNADWRGLFIESLKDELPGEVATTVDFRAATSSTGVVNVRLLPILSVTQRLCRTRVDRIGRLAADINATNTSLRIDDSLGNPVTGLVGETIIIGREAITLIGYSAPNYGCTRGRLGTVAVSHEGRTVPGADAEVFLADHGHLREDREIELIRVVESGGEADEEILYRGVVKNVSQSGAVVSVSTRTAMEVLRGRKLMSNPWRRRLRYVSAAEARILRVLDDPNMHRGLTDGNLFIPISLGGKSAVLNRYDPFVAGGVEEMAVQVRNLGGPRTRAFADSAQPETIPEDGIDIWEFASTAPDAPGVKSGGVRLGETAGGDTGNPFTLVLQLLLTTVQGDNHPTYDLGNQNRPRIGENLGLAIPADLVDIEAIERVRARTPARMDSIHIGFDGEPIDALEFIQQRLLRPYGCVLTVGDGYRLTVVRIASLRPITAKQLEAGDFIGIPETDFNLGATFDRASVEYFDRPGRELIREGFTDQINRRRLASGRHDTIELDCRGVARRRLVSSLIRGWVQRWHQALPRVRFVANNLVPMWPGELISVSNPGLFATDGTRGVEGQTLLIIERRQSLRDASISYGALDVGAAFERLGRIAGSLEVVSGASSTITHAQNAYTANAASGDEIEDDNEAFAIGDLVVLANADLSIKDATAKTVSAIPTATTVELTSSVWATIAAGDVVVPAAYTVASAAQRALWAFLADSTPLVGSDEPYEFDA